MDFGKVESLENIDFSLPADRPETTTLLAKAKKMKPEIYVGCAKWGRKDWIGTIYPEGTKEKDFLPLYAKHFNCIELNATFYRLPTVKQITGWKEMVGEDFKFAPKFTQSITHFKRLKDAEEVTTLFLKGISAFEENLGPVFLQLPPNFTPKSFDTLEAYLKSLPKDLNIFVELRSPKWFDDEEVFTRVFDMFEKNNVGAVITDASGRRDCVHMRLTTTQAFLRYVGNGLHPTDYSRIDDWVQRIKNWKEKVSPVYFFMHQHEEVHSPVLSKYVIQQINKHCGTSIAEPKFIE